MGDLKILIGKEKTFSGYLACCCVKSPSLYPEGRLITEPMRRKMTVKVIYKMNLQDTFTIN